MKVTVTCDTMIHYLQNVCVFVTDLYVKELPGCILRRYDFDVCNTNVHVWSSREWLLFEMRGPIIVNETFQDMTEVTFVFKNCYAPISTKRSEQIFEAFKVTKKQFEKSDILEKKYFRKYSCQ